ncbi:type II toxin-antitoxin system VapC family toxin [Pelomicrobium methylotrophicum]|uniref:Ribonuclease VapC n=1 Tax=Pelomicrobium methylotrophicum TaxID=2602750 RepID=A0A5C7EH76_9PROT|nr:type II toxin-antitoxin system VapC family toxin [Pelomicrobium methylotrophicum]TXF10635.1 type II toxin-antitoxin system VapC family toxin [Pelomicrobium methylotrophicum]
MILLDTHALVWADSDVKKLGRRSRGLIERLWSRGEVAVSALSFWEVAVLQAARRLDLPMPAAQWRTELLDGGLKEVPVDGAIALRAAGLGALPGDPIDRLIVATALERGAALMTADEGLLGWEHALKRHDARL